MSSDVINPEKDDVPTILLSEISLKSRTRHSTDVIYEGSNKLEQSPIYLRQAATFSQKTQRKQLKQMLEENIQESEKEKGTSSTKAAIKQSLTGLAFQRQAVNSKYDKIESFMALWNKEMNYSNDFAVNSNNSHNSNV